MASEFLWGTGGSTEVGTPPERDDKRKEGEQTDHSQANARESKAPGRS